MARRYYFAIVYYLVVVVVVVAEILLADYCSHAYALMLMHRQPMGLLMLLLHGMMKSTDLGLHCLQRLIDGCCSSQVLAGSVELLWIGIQQVSWCMVLTIVL